MIRTQETLGTILFYLNDVHFLPYLHRVSFGQKDRGWVGIEKQSLSLTFPLPTKSRSESIQISILRTGSLTNLIYMPHSKVVPAPARLMPLLIIGPFRTQNGSRGGSWKGSTELAEKGQQPRVSQKCTTRRKSSSFSLNFYWVGGFFA